MPNLAMQMDVPENDMAGHRARLRERLLDIGGDGLLDHELIEYLLGLAIPRRDTKPLAKSLLKEFGGIGGLMHADPAAIRRVSGISETALAAIKIAHATALRMLRNEVKERPVISNWQALIDYLYVDMAHATVERVRILHLNTRNALIRDEVMSEGSIDEAPLYVREVIRRAMDIGSAAIIMVHNHPSGEPTPSRADIDLTRRVMEAGKPFGISVHDHLIIGSNGHASLRALGLI